MYAMANRLNFRLIRFTRVKLVRDLPQHPFLVSWIQGLRCMGIFGLEFGHLLVD
jgi:hypothetical protein